MQIPASRQAIRRGPEDDCLTRAIWPWQDQEPEDTTMNKPKLTMTGYAIVVAIAVFLVSAAAFAEIDEAGLQRVNAGDQIRNEEFVGVAGSLIGHQRTRRVRCDRGANLARAIQQAKEYDTIEIVGTCYESVVVKTDNLSIFGNDGASIDGSQSPSEAVLLIDGARHLKLEGFTVQNGSDQGILATRQAQAVLTGLTLQNNGTVGLSVDRSHLEIENLVLDNNRTGGMDAYTSSTIVVKGVVSASNNGGDGLVANGKTFLELRGAQVTASMNAGSGVSIINDSRLQIFSFPEAQGSTINADSNGFAGVGILGAELGVVGSEYFGSGANVITASNNIIGFFAPAGAILSPHATAQFVATNNGVGMLMEDGASALIIGGLNLTGNGAGLSAIGAGTLTLVSVPPNPSTIDTNQFDLDLGFGTRVTITDVAFTSIACDASVLIRGAECP